MAAQQSQRLTDFAGDGAVRASSFHNDLRADNNDCVSDQNENRFPVYSTTHSSRGAVCRRRPDRRLGRDWACHHGRLGRPTRTDRRAAPLVGGILAPRAAQSEQRPVCHADIYHQLLANVSFSAVRHSATTCARPLRANISAPPERHRMSPPSLPPRPPTPYTLASRRRPPPLPSSSSTVASGHLSRARAHAHARSSSISIHDGDGGGDGGIGKRSRLVGRLIGERLAGHMGTPTVVAQIRGGPRRSLGAAAAESSVYTISVRSRVGARRSARCARLVDGAGGGRTGPSCYLHRLTRAATMSRDGRPDLGQATVDLSLILPADRPRLQ